MGEAASSLTPARRRALRQALSTGWPFVGRFDLGPQAVTAGECDRCGQEPRMVQPCGPPPADLLTRATRDWALGRRCAIQAGPEGWCDGHAAEAEALIADLRALPRDADDIARLWWVATGEVRPDPTLLQAAERALEAGLR